MISYRSIVPMFAVVAMLAGCSAETSSTTGADSANTKTGLTKEEASKDGKLGRRPGPPHGGPDFLVFAALHENINLTAEQRTTLENLVAQNKPSAPPAIDKSRMTTLASAVRSGKIDANALAIPKGDIEQKMAEHRAKAAQSLTTLHATLTKEQRSALVDAIAAKKGNHMGHGPRPEGANGPEGHGPRPEGEAHGGPHGPHGGPFGGFMLEGLDLTQAQKDQIKSQLDAQRPSAPPDREAMKAKFETMKKEMDAKLQTFKADSFDANAFLAPPADAPKMGPENHSERMAKELQIIVSVLTDAQREKLAQKIEQGPPARPEGR